MRYDLTILTDSRYVNPKEITQYIQNVLHEDGLLHSACERLGLKVYRTNWDDKEFDWCNTKYVIFRTTWDYFERFDEFSSWLSSVSTKTKLINSKELIYWNLDKKYLVDLESKGVRIPPTMYIEKGDSKTISEFVQMSGWSKFILKPAVSGAARHTYKFSKGEESEYTDLFQKLIAEESMMLQEYQEQITTKGEVSYMLFGGKFSHAILKKAKPGDFRVQDDFGGTIHAYSPSVEEIKFAEFALSKCIEPPVYARVDVFWDNDDNLVLGELEMIEPELWFRKSDVAADLCAKALLEFMNK